MTTIKLPTFAVNGELELNYVSDRQSGYGHKTIIVELIYKNQAKTFSKTTNNMPDYDEATELEGVDKKIALFNLISSSIEEAVAVWTQDVDYEEENATNED